jgi:hypothetical protein
MWDIHSTPVMDIFDSFNPDVFLGQTYNTTRALCTAIKERPHMKVIMKAGDWGPLTDQIDSVKYPILKASEQEKRIILDLYEEVQKPDYVHIQYHPTYLEDTHGYWKYHGIPINSMMSGADIFEYTNGQFRTEFYSDITFIGGYWQYKAETANQYLIPLCNNFKHRIKIFGNNPWPVPQYCGYIQNEIVKDVLASATICPNLSEPHSQIFGFDIIERPFKLLSNKCFVISDYVEGLNKLFGEKLVMAKSPVEFWEKIDYFIKNPNERLSYIQQGYKEVVNKHTYFHRVSEIFSNLELLSQANKCDEIYQNIKKEL